MDPYQRIGAIGMSDIYPPVTTAGLLKIREDWLKVIAVPSPHGGFDIALVIDGTYSLDHYDPTELLRTWNVRIREALAQDGLPLGVPISKCPGRAAVLGDEPMPALLPGADGETDPA